MNREDSERLLTVIRADINRHQSEILRLRDLEMYLVERAGPGASTPAPPSEATPNAVDAAERLLRTRAPLTTHEIVDALLAEGYPVAGPPGERRRKLANLLYAEMRKLPERFARVRKGVWGLPGPDGGACKGCRGGRRPRQG